VDGVRALRHRLSRELAEVGEVGEQAPEAVQDREPVRAQPLDLVHHEHRLEEVVHRTAELRQRRERGVVVALHRHEPSHIAIREVERIGERTLTARAKGDAIDDVIKRLAERTVTDVQIELASLEDVFLEFYRAENGEGAPAVEASEAATSARDDAEGGEVR